jgi:hypothetical protein
VPARAKGLPGKSGPKILLPCREQKAAPKKGNMRQRLSRWTDHYDSDDSCLFWVVLLIVLNFTREVCLTRYSWTP